MVEEVLPSRTEASRFSHHTYALVVGVSDYRDTGLEDLPACEHEAEALANALIDTAGCAIPADQVVCLPQVEATSTSILAAFERLAGTAGPSDLLIFYFAGHGITDGEEFVLCTGASDDRSGVRASDLDKVLGRSNTRGILVIVDCCGGAALAENAPTFFYRLEESDFRLFMSASRSEQSSWELPDGRGSLFTRHLLRVLNGEEVVGQRGEIFFTDLFDYLHTAVQSDAQKVFGSRDAQEPVFSGSFSKDPLLFLHKDRSLSNIRVQTERVTRADLRRQVTVALAALTILVFLVVGGYWAFLESQQHFKLDRDQITLVHGHPEMSGFGLPKTEWTYPLGPESLALESGLEESWTLTIARSADPERALRRAVLPHYQAQLFLWQGRHEEAKRVFHADPQQFLMDDVGYQVLLDLVGPGDVSWLQQQIAGADAQQAASLIAALARIDQKAAARALISSTVADSIGHQLNLLDVWRSPCVEPLQTWMDSFLARTDAFYALPAVAQVAVRTGCRFPLDATVLASERHMESAVYALRLTNPEALPEFRSEVAATIRNDLDAGIDVFDSALPAKHRMLAVRSAAFARYLDEMPCFPDWVERFRNDVFDPLDQAGRLNALVAVARNCKDALIEIEVGVVALRVLLKIEERAQTEALYVRTVPEINAAIITVLDALRHGGASGRVAALTALLDEAEDADLRLNIIERLRLEGADGANALDYALPNQFRLERALFRWLADSDPKAASARLRERIVETRDMNLVEALSFVALEQSDKYLLIAEVGTLDTRLRVATIALVGSIDQVAALFVDPDPKVRAIASTHAPLNPLWPEIISAAARNVRRADPFLLAAEGRFKTAKSLAESLAATPAWAREWLAKWIEHSGIRDPGVALLFERAKGYPGVE